MERKDAEKKVRELIIEGGYRSLFLTDEIMDPPSGNLLRVSLIKRWDRSHEYYYWTIGLTVKNFLGFGKNFYYWTVPILEPGEAEGLFLV